MNTYIHHHLGHLQLPVAHRGTNEDQGIDDKTKEGFRDVIEPGLQFAGSQARTLFCQPANRTQARKPEILKKKIFLVLVVKK